MQPRSEILTEKKLVGIRTLMSFAQDSTPDLWRQFMPRRKEILNSSNNNLYSIEQYDDPLFFGNFNPQSTYTKWAAIEVPDFNAIPTGMEAITIPAGDYVVFVHRGMASDAQKTYQYIFGTWLPAATVVLDQRPHFALMGEHYRADDPNAEEEIWIPVTPK